MAVSRKPKEETTQQVSDKTLEEYLRKGGSTAKTQTAPVKDVRFSLTIPAAICEELDTLRDSRRLKVSRHKWVLEAIVEKLERERAESSAR
jgi:hypothetical protein